MAMLFKTDGERIPVKPANGKSFKLQEAYRLLEVEMVEVIRLHGDAILICDEEGKLHAEPQFNPMATLLYQLVYGKVDEIYGNAILCLDAEFR